MNGWHLHELETTVRSRLSQFEQEETAARIWRRDHTVWSPDPTEISDRLGWLVVHEAMAERLPDLEEFASSCARDGLSQVVLAGMGGSSLAPEVLRATFGVASGRLDLVVLDTTHPDQIRAVEDGLDLDRTLFLIASKSGTTTETLSHLAYFWAKFPHGSRFAAITDPGTPLEELATERGFRRTFLNPPDIGGRYSALSYFGLVPAALLGVDLEGLLRAAGEAARECAPTVAPAENPGARLGALLGEAALHGRDKLTLVLGERIAAFGFWIEQLIAESTGKHGRGIVPVEGEDVGPPAVYGEDRVFVALGEDALGRSLRPLDEAGHPVSTLSLEDPLRLGAEFFRWEFATAVAGAVLGINPFDQPNVAEAKDNTKRILAAGAIPDPGYDDLGDLLAQVRPGDYLAIQAYLPRTAETSDRLHAARMRLRDRLKVATTVGYGPRFLHSTGQLHKGGPDTGVFVQIMEAPKADLPIPGEPYSFGTLLAAQATGDLQSLRDRGRRVGRVRLADLERAAGE